jgi:uncharacterized protein involved in response to NO
VTAPAIPPGLVTENLAMKAAPAWRREPYAVFFPLGLLLSWAGVGRWLDVAVAGHSANYLPVYIFHSMVQIQGFLLCFALGFLFTMIPRRTGTAPPSSLEMAIGLGAPLLTAVAAWNQAWALSQAGWLAACFLLVVFVLRRFLSATARRRPPTSFVWIPVALLFGIVGSLLTGSASALGGEWMELHNLGQQLVLQGVFIALILGVGGLALPLMTRGTAPADAEWRGRDFAAVGGHLVAALLLAASFVVQWKVSVPAGCGLRAAVIVAEYLLAHELWRPPSLPGWNRRVVWLSAWCLPLGLAVAALFPEYYQGGLHVSFVGGFAALTLAVSTHVILGHGDRGDLLNGRPWPIALMALLMVAATVSRVAMTVQPLHREAWMATAVFFFLTATLVWAGFLMPVLRQRLR